MSLLVPIPRFMVQDSLGRPIVGAQIETYEAGTSNPKATFKDSTGSTANTNPVITDQRGEADIWATGSVKLVVKDSSGVTLYTVDNLTGVGSGDSGASPVSASEWLQQPDSPTYVSATTFTVTGDVTATYHVGRRVRAQVSGGTAYGTITSSTFSTGITTVVATYDSLSLDSGLSTLWVGINSADNPSISDQGIQGLVNDVPVGAILHFGGATPPTGYLLCDGSAYNAVTNPEYAALYSVIANTYGGTDNTDFQVPDARGRSLMGFGQGDTAEGGGSGTVRSSGDKVGAETHTLVNSELPSVIGNAAYANADGAAVQFVSASDGGDGVPNAGGDQPHNNVGPTLVVGAIIKF